jgi:hypothetical protein
LLAKLPNLLLFGGGVVLKINDEMIGAIGAAGAPRGRSRREPRKSRARKNSRPPAMKARRFGFAEGGIGESAARP